MVMEYYILKIKKKKYDGEFINDKFDGKGKYFCENGNYYIGSFSNGNKYGKGTLYNSNNEIKYQFDADKTERNEEHIYDNGNYYIGPWLNGLKHGKERNIIQIIQLNMKETLLMINMKEMENTFGTMVITILGHG